MNTLFQFASQSPSDTANFAKLLAPHIQANTIIGLVGDLGSGKTFFVQSLAKALGVGPRIEVTSPTFTIIQEYPGGQLPIYHIDFYRLNNGKEVENLGLEEYFSAGGVTLVEWADRYPGTFPNDTLWIHFSMKGNHERLLSARGSKIWRDLGRQFGENSESR